MFRKNAVHEILRMWLVQYGEELAFLTLRRHIIRVVHFSTGNDVAFQCLSFELEKPISLCALAIAMRGFHELTIYMLLFKGSIDISSH